ncbi:MAG TPA: CcmD family protein [Anaerolineae bacterium]
MNVTLQDLQAEIHNVAFLFSAYTVIWVIVLGYIVWLARRTQKLRADIAELKESIQSEPSKQRL